MPAYAALSDLLARFEERELIQITDDAGAGIVDGARVDEACESVSGTIDAYLAGLYQLPLARVPALLVGVCCDMARFRLWQRKGSPIESVEKANTAATRTLEQIAKGVLKIDAGRPEQPVRDGVVIFDGPEPQFTRDRMKGF